MHTSTPFRRQEDRYTDTCRVMQLLCSFHPSSGSPHATELKANQPHFSFASCTLQGFSRWALDRAPVLGWHPPLFAPATFHLSPSPLQDLIPEMFSWYLLGKLASVTVHFPSGHKPGTLFKLLGSQAGGPMIPCLLELWISALRLWVVTTEPQGQGISIHIFLLLAPHSGIFVQTLLSSCKVNQMRQW